MTLRTALEQGTKLLKEGAVEAPRLNAQVLLAHAIRKDRTFLFSHSNDELEELGWIHYGRYLHQRLSGVPTQYITRRQEFFGREFHVSPSVLIPRPETEHLVTAAMDRIRSGNIVLDVGTGSGAIAITLALESASARVWAMDISARALQVAVSNAERLGAKVAFACADLTTAVAPNSLHTLISNPPYIAESEFQELQPEVRDHEPYQALVAEDDGMAAYRRIIDDATRVLRRDGWLLLELGYRSLEPVRTMLSSRWRDVESVNDLAGIPRVLTARWSAQ